MSRIRTFAVLVVTLVMVGGPLLGVLDPSRGATLAWLAFAVLASFVAALLIERRDESDGNESGNGSVWEFVPNEQYDGRFAEAGGLTRGEQEAEIERINEQAAKRR